MTSIQKKHGSVLFAAIGALAILCTAWWTRGTAEANNAWLYVFCIWLIFYSAYEVYTKTNKAKLAYAIIAIPFGVFLFIFGGYDDSPGAQLLGLILVILGNVGIWKSGK